MLQTILVPLDGSELAERALPYATGLARASGARIVVFHVKSAYGSPHEPSFDPEVVAERLRADGLTAEGLTYDMYVGGRGSVIASAARDQHADLIVMSTHGRTGPGRWFYGSVAADVLQRTTLPVLMIPARIEHAWPSGRPTCVLVPLDGTALAEEALGPACQLAVDGDLVLLRVVDPMVHGYIAGYGYVEPVSDAAVTDAEAYLKAVASQLPSPGVRMMPRALVGEAADVIAAEAEVWNVDLVAMATHGRTGFARLMLGSVAAGTLQRVDVPVLFVRPGAAAAHAAAVRAPRADATEAPVALVLDAEELSLVEHALQQMLLPERDPALAEPTRALLERLGSMRGAAPVRGPTPTHASSVQAAGRREG